MNEQSLFLEALEIPDPTEQAAFLDRACAADQPLRRRLDRLLEQHRAADSFLDHPVEVAATANLEPPAVPTPEVAAAEAPGTVIGPYKLLAVIGEGGMGTVYLADQAEPIRRRVALKLIKPGMDSKQVLARFEAERQALALMDHQNIARVLDAGTTPAGRPYFVMELVKGVPITRYCDEKRLTPRERLELFVDVCRAVQHAHQKGVIHRDLKPSNVLVAPYDGRPVIKVIDFGVAKATGQQLTDKTLFTGLGAVVGTLEYMSPEQAELNNQDVDTRSDIYALGVLLYELLTGTTPMDRKRLREVGMLEVLRVIRQEEPPRPSTRLSSSETLPKTAAARHTEPARLLRLVRGDLDWIVMKALEKDRDRRYETANGFAMDVLRFLGDETIVARPPTPGYRLRKFVRKNRGPVFAAALVVAVLVAGVIGTTAGLFRANAAERLATQRLVEVTEERNRADAAAAESRAVNDFLTEDLLGQADPDKNSPDKRVTVEQLLRRAEKRIDGNSRFADKPGTEATLHYTIAKTYAKLGLLPEAERHLRRAVALRREGLGPDRPETLAAQEALADFLNLYLQRPGESEPLAKQTWEARARVLGPEDRDTLDSLDTYAIAVGLAGRKVEAIGLSRRCLDARRRTLGAEDEQTLISMNNLAVQLNEVGQHNESASLFREVFTVRRKKAGPPSELVGTVYNLANSLDLAGDLAEADKLVAEYLEWAVRLIGPDNGQVDRLSGLAVRVALDVGRLDDAITRGQEVLGRRRKNYPPGNYQIGAVLSDLGRARALQGKYEDAERDLGEAHGIIRNAPQRQAFWVHWAQCWHGASLTGLKRYADAEPLLLEAEEGLRTARGTPTRFQRVAVEHLIALYDKWGRPAQAGEWQKKLPPVRPSTEQKGSP